MKKILRYLRKCVNFDKFYDLPRPVSSFFRYSFFTIPAVLFLGIAGLYFYVMYLSIPAGFPISEVIEVERGETLSQVAEKLESRSLVHHPKILEWSVILFGGERNVVAGSYYFPEKIGVIKLAKRLTGGKFGLAPKKITFPEGVTVEEIALLMEQEFPVFSSERFIELAGSREGFLFPDTYSFFPNVRAETVIETMLKTFKERTKELRQEIEEDDDRTLRDVVIMASILEKEAWTTESRKIISGILWKRLEIDMPLQVDAAFSYYINRNTYELTKEDLRSDSPYNTYRYKGLPAGPIANPGLDSIKAAMNPIKSPYLFYLSDRLGNLYYSKTLSRHQVLKRKYVN